VKILPEWMAADAIQFASKHNYECESNNYAISSRDMKPNKPHAWHADAGAPGADSNGTGSARSADELLHELQEYQIELEYQNDELRRSQLAVEAARDRYIDFYDFAPVGYITLNHLGVIVEANLTGAALLGVERRKLTNRNFAALVCRDNADRWYEYFIKVLNHDARQTCELYVLRGDGSRLAVRLDSLRLVRDGQVPVARIALTDNTERKQAEQEQQRLNRILRSFRAGGWALVQARNEADYLREFCRIVVDECGYAMIWVGYREHDAERSVRRVASYGFESGYFDWLRVSWADNELGRGPTGTAIRTGQAAICHDMSTDPNFLPWREQALQRGYSSSIALPLADEAATFGALTIYSQLPDPFSESEVQMLQQLVNELAYGINVLRLRVLRDSHEAKLAASESRFRLLAASTFEGIGITEQGRIVDCNEQLLKMLGYTRAELIGTLVSDLVPAEDQDTVVANIADGIESIIEHTLLRKDGRRIIVEAHGQNFEREHGKRITAIRDITERKHAEEILRKNEERFQLATEVGHVGTWERDMVTGESFWSRSHFELLGYQPYAVVPSYRAWIDRVHPDDRSRVESELSRCMRDHEEYVIEYRLVWPDGSERWVRAQGRHRYDAEGNCTGIAGALNDITESKRSMALLRESEEQYRLLFENILDGFAYCKGLYEQGELQDFVFLHVNSQFAKLTGFPDVIGKKLSDVVPGILTDNPEFLDVSRRVAATGNPEGFETHVARLDRWATITIYSPVKEHFVAVFRDITDQKRAEQELLFMNSQLAHEVARQTANLSDLTAHIQNIAEQERARLARELHDELGSTLVGMSMEVGHLRGKATDPQVLKGLAVLKDLVNHAVEIKRAVIDELYPGVLDHEGFTGALTWMVNDFRQRSGIEVELRMPLEIEMENPYALAAYRITQECLTNIAKHAGASNVTLEAHANAGFLELTVHDNGVGLPPDTITSGHGILGMTERARYLGGSMKFESGSRKGTTAHLRIPLSASRPANRKRVMVVDDHAIVRDALRRLINETDDFSVEGEASDGKSAIQMGVEGEWDVILLDISLPKVNGMEVLEKIRAVKTNTPIIMLSSYAADDYGDEAIRKGAACYLEKGATDELVKEMRRATLRN
jgi:PAS domain S-box-containing protein